MKINKAILFSYGKYLATSFGTAILISYGNTHKVGLNDLKWAGISVIASVIPVLRNYFNKKYTGYGKIIDQVATDLTNALSTEPKA